VTIFIIAPYKYSYLLTYRSALRANAIQCDTICRCVYLCRNEWALPL